VKCPRCHSICLESDPYCYACRRPFVSAIPMRNVAKVYGSRLALLFMAVGACLGPIVGRAFFPGYSTELFDAPSMAFAASGGGLGAALGYLLGAFVLTPEPNWGPEWPPTSGSSDRDL
jgi:hypothetical protein